MRPIQSVILQIQAFDLQIQNRLDAVYFDLLCFPMRSQGGIILVIINHFNETFYQNVFFISQRISRSSSVLKDTIDTYIS